MPLNMVPSPWLDNFLKQYERFRPTAYKPTPSDKWTCGYGHTNGVTETTTCTMATALEWLDDDRAQAVLDVCRLVHVPLTQAQFDALCSLVFNAGPEPLEKTLGQMLNARNYAGAAMQLKRWDRQAGKELDGLLKRRTAEANHFMGQDNAPIA